MTVWLVAAYAALALGLAWAISSRGSWAWRAPYVVAAPALAFALWLGKPSAAGWPTLAKMPAHAGLQWAVVDEPDPATNDPGRIYLWLDVGAVKPRAFSVPYSRPLHQQVMKALKQVKLGRPISVERTRPQRHERSARGKSSPGQRSPLHFYATPPPGLPPKTK